MEKKTLRYEVNMSRLNLIDQFLSSIGAPDCGNPECDHKIGSIVLGTEVPTWLSDDPQKPDNGVLTCGNCGNFHGESLQAFLSGEIVEL